MNLRELFRRALQASVIAPVALAGCGPDTTGYVPVECDDSQFSVRGLQPAVIPDVIELRSVNGRDFDRESMPFKMSTEGTPCATASMPSTCQASFESLSPMSGFASQCLQICVDYHLATTKGDEVKAVATLEELKTFLGPIDTPQEAMLIAFANNFKFACGRADQGSARPNGTGWDVIAIAGFACGPGTAVTRHYLTVSKDGELTQNRVEIIERGDPNCAIGRRPPGLSDCLPVPSGEGRGGRGEGMLGRHFAEAARLEAASVPAFERLSLELALHGAPAELREAMLSAALEELHHTQITSSLAREFGGTPRAPEVTERPLRSLFELALDNATEGCVRETFGALVAQHQAMHAKNPRVREAMSVIARDELRHAELSWALNEWAEGQLDAEAKTQLRLARRDALERLRVELEAAVDDALINEAGVPSAAIAQQLFREVSASLAA